MLKSLQYHKGLSAGFISNNNNISYQQKVMRILCVVGIFASVCRFIFIVSFYIGLNIVNEIIVNIVPTLILCSTYICYSYNKYALGRLFTMALLPIAICIVARFYNDVPTLNLLLLFSVLSFVVFDKSKHHTIYFIYTFLLFVATNIIISKHNAVEYSSIHPLAIAVFNHCIFFAVFYVGLFLLRNTFNTLFKKVHNDNAALSEINADLMSMHNELTSKNKILEKEQDVLSNTSKKNNKLFSIIAHDVKAPLLSVKAILDYTKDDVNQTQLNEFLPEIRKTISNTVGLLENLLVWSKSKETNLSAKQEIIHLNDFLAKTVELYSVTIKSKNLLLEMHNDVNVFVQFNKEMLHTVLRNLISNAVKYTVHNGTIIIKATRMDSKVVLYISNTAYTVNEEQIRLLNTQQDANTRSMQNEMGSGLGLMIVKDFLAKNNAPIQFYTEQEKFITCEVQLQSYNNQVLTAISTKGKKDYLVAAKYI